MKCFIYCRVSRDDSSRKRNETRNSIKYQEKVCRDFALNKGFTIVDTFMDNDVSGTLMPEERPEMSRMWARLSEVNAIIVLDASRTNRRTEVAECILKDLLFTQTDLIGAQERIDIHTSQGRMIFKIMNVVNENAVSVSREKSINSMQDMAKKGLLAPNPSSFGYRPVRKNVVEVVPEEAEIVKLIYSLCIEGMTTVQISMELNKRGLKTKRGAAWRETTVASIIRSPRYRGKIYLPKPLPEGLKLPKNKRERIMYDSPFPPIVSDDDWEYAQLKIKSRRVTVKGAGRLSHLLSGVMTCTKCGLPYGYQNGGSVTESVYKCKGKQRKPVCDSLRIHHSAERIFDEFFCQEIMEDFSVTSNEGDSKIKSLELDCSRLTQKLEDIEQKVLDNPNMADLLNSVHVKAKKEIEKLVDKISEEKMSGALLTDDQKRRARYNKLTDKQKNILLKEIAEIYIYGEWFIVTIKKTNIKSGFIGRLVRKMVRVTEKNRRIKSIVPTFKGFKVKDIPEQVRNELKRLTSK